MAEDMNHPDEAQDQVQIDANLQQLIAELEPVLMHLLQQNQDLAQKVSELEDLVMNKMIGGLVSAKRGSDLEALKSKYGEMFAPHLDYKKAVHGADPEGFWEALLDQMKGGPEDDEMIQGHLGRMNDEMEQHKALLLGKPAAAVEVKAEGEPEAVKEAAQKVPEQVENAVEAAPEKKEESPAVGSKEYFSRYKRKGKPSSKAQE